MTNPFLSAPEWMTEVQAGMFSQLFPVHNPEDPIENIIAEAIRDSEDFPYRYRYFVEAIAAIGDWLIGEEEWTEAFDTAYENWSDVSTKSRLGGSSAYMCGLLLSCLAGMISGKKDRVDEVVGSHFPAVTVITVDSTFNRARDIAWGYIDGDSDLPFAWWANLNYSPNETKAEVITT